MMKHPRLSSEKYTTIILPWGMRWAYSRVEGKKRATPVFMVTKSCTKILNFSTRFSCQHFAVEDFVTLPMGKKSCRWGNVMFGHGFDKLV